ncbi:hypothetical protein RHMOL_Rhmol04G0364700 [Rhododendron molle]|uniref:Uncharacterized protein n=1 Tax=Rhododendron molle TaxID=49168 RepID=A0ACC0P7T4_RHOML|nr:hypothetical protein RHMOL_Rhmol04G0364700 [Rhododendron molle]
MAKVVALIASALCILALAGVAQSQKDEFVVKGQVYCDTCRVLFQTKLSKNVAAAGVELKCRSRLKDTETLSVTSQTDEAGAYEITVKGDHADDICQVHAVHSPGPVRLRRDDAGNQLDQSLPRREHRHEVQRPAGGIEEVTSISHTKLFSTYKLIPLLLLHFLPSKFLKIIIMAPITYDTEVTSSIPPAKLFKAFVIDGDTLVPKVLPQAVKSVETLQGDGGPGTVRLITFGEGSKHKCVKHKVDAVDKENFTYSYSIIEGDALDGFESISYHIKFAPSPNGGSIYKTRSIYCPKGDNKVTEEEIKSGKEKASIIFKAVEAYLLANPDC